MTEVPWLSLAQVTQGGLNAAVQCLNAHALAHPDPADWVLNHDDVTKVFAHLALGEKQAKTVLLSLIHLKRLQMLGRENRTYQIQRTAMAPRA